MFRPLALCIGLRYTRAKRSNHFISFIAGTSMIGIALGVTVLITVLSVMNGFDVEIHDRFFGMAPQVTVTSFSGSIRNWQAAEKTLNQFPGVDGVTPYAGGQGILTADGNNVPIVVAGIIPSKETRVTDLDHKMIDGKISNLKAGEFGIAIGKALADRLSVSVGDKLTLLLPQATISPVGLEPRMKRFTVVGIFSAGSGFGFDDRLAFINMNDGQQLFSLGDKISGFRLKIRNIYAAPQLSAQLQKTLAGDFQVTNWTDEFGAFFKAVKLEKTMMFTILTLIIAVAAFNLVSSLVMAVNDKQSEIAIMRTYGASPKLIHRIFMVQGLVIGVVGTLIGLICGLLLAYNVTAIVDWLQKFFHIQVLSSNVYLVDFLPSKIQLGDVINVCGIAFFMSFIATIYPARKAAAIEPAQALRYD